MAQAARLSLRMQKELKLLLSEPPLGASFPRLSADSDNLPSLSNIDAQIEGPDGTVYSKGIFNIKIQIPERYPFQPPIVTFATPIYHPNIDNGGRICLDILNLPPKGAWQPSLNISAVLTSIGLLLSEPNPDDGLMCEASKEYKYNRQAFDQKARAMTQKYAKGSAVGNSSSSHIQNSLKTSRIKGNMEVSEPEGNDASSCYKKPSGITQKSSPKLSSMSHEKKCYTEVNEVPDDQPLLSDTGHQNEANKKRKEIKGLLDEINLGNRKPQLSRRKLSLASSGQAQKKDGYYNEPVTHNVDLTSSNPCQGIEKEPVRNLGTCETNFAYNLDMPVTSEVMPERDGSTRLFSMDHKISHPYEDSTTSIKSKKPCLVGKKLSLGLKNSSLEQERDNSNKENAMPLNNFAEGGIGSRSKVSLRPLGQQQQEKDVDNNRLLVKHKNGCGEKMRMDQNQDEQVTVGNNKKPRSEEAQITETIVVLDSEDSEEEKKGSLRSKLSLARRGIGKLKNKA